MLLNMSLSNVLKNRDLRQFYSALICPTKNNVEYCIAISETGIEKDIFISNEML